MFESIREFCARLLRIPPDPEPPPGDESSTHRFRAAPNFFKYLLFLWMLKSVLWFLVVSWVMIVPTIGSIALTRKGHEWGWFLLLLPGAALLVFLASRLFALAVLRLDFEKRWYLVTNRSLRVREGLVLVREMTVTFANIQNISTAQGPIQRALGIADLRVDTAGGGGMDGRKHPGQNLHTAWFRGIDNANEVRELIQERLRHLKDSGSAIISRQHRPPHQRPFLRNCSRSFRRFTSRPAPSAKRWRAAALPSPTQTLWSPLQRPELRSCDG